LGLNNSTEEAVGLGPHDDVLGKVSDPTLVTVELDVHGGALLVIARHGRGPVAGYRASMQQLALFDLDDTLVDRRGAFNAWAEEFAAARGLDDKALTLMVMADAHHSGPMDAYFAMICETLALDEAPGLLWEQYRRRVPELVSCRAEDLDALRRLRAAEWRIGIVSNGMVDNQLAKINNTGLSRLVDGWAISAELGIRKPDPGIFRFVAGRCGADPDQGGWMIGDSLVLDVAGGHAAGLQTIWLQPTRRARSRSFTGPAPDFVVDSVAEAVDTLLGRQSVNP
jgi:HAD superfamily hydrolase (TIGR01549 family)